MKGLVLYPGAFRLFLASLVLLSHVSGLETGRLGVALFFVLSGYWISDLWDRQGGPGMIPLFLLNRFLRIWPLYMLVMVAAALWFRTPLGLSNFTIFGVASNHRPNPLGVEWSLDIEAQFYALLPILMLLNVRLLLLAIPCALAWWIDYQFGVRTVFLFAPAFAAGMLIYRSKTKPLIISPMVSLAAFAALTALIYAIPALRGNLFKSQPDLLQVDVFAMLWLAPLLPYVAGSLRLKSSPLDRHVGNLAYPLYLVHFPILHAFGLTGLVEKMLVSALAFGVAVLLYILVDVPIEKGRYASLDALIRARARQRRAVAT